MRLEWAGRSHVASERHGGGRAVEKTGCSFCLLSLALGAFRVCGDLILPAIPVLWQPRDRHWISGLCDFALPQYRNFYCTRLLWNTRGRRGIDCVKHPDGFLCQNIDEAAVVTGGSVLQTGSSWSSEQTLLQTHKVETESRIFIPTVRYHATQHELNKNMHPTRDGKHEPHSRFLSSQGTNWGRGRENQNPDWMRWGQNPHWAESEPPPDAAVFSIFG